MVEYKQAILLRKDLKLPLGKACAQTAHASLEAAFDAAKSIVQEWSKQGMKKVILKVADEKELMQFFDMAKRAKLPVGLIRDAGRTVLEPGTITCLGIGPADENEIDKLTGKLKLV